MDSEEDFLNPEFLNILFFQQKNLVIFPYVDLKHLHVLEIFTAGYTVVDLESTVLHELKNILQFESSNSYSQNPTLYFIYNLDKSKVKDIMGIEGIRCILNSNEPLSELANGSTYIFYNKKSSKFINYPENEIDLEFETSLISSASSPSILQDRIQNIKSTATRIFEQTNKDNSPEKLANFLKEFDPKFWQKILDFTAKFYDITVPYASELLRYASDKSFTKPQEKDHQDPKDFSDEYELIVSKNKVIGKEFIQLIHEYRSRKVNPSHLKLEQLFSPQKLYNYLRNRHWKNGIPESFIKEWSEMNLSQYELTDEDLLDFEEICTNLGILHIPKTLETQVEPVKSSLTIPEDVLLSQDIIRERPSLQHNWQEYKIWLSERLDSISQLIEKGRENQSFKKNPDFTSYLWSELSDLRTLCNSLLTEIE